MLIESVQTVYCPALDELCEITISNSLEIRGSYVSYMQFKNWPLTWQEIANTTRFTCRITPISWKGENLQAYGKEYSHWYIDFNHRSKTDDCEASFFFRPMAYHEGGFTDKARQLIKEPLESIEYSAMTTALTEALKDLTAQVEPALKQMAFDAINRITSETKEALREFKDCISEQKE